MTSETRSGCPGEHKIVALGAAVRAGLGATVALKYVLVVQENLKFEQHSVLQFNWVLVHCVLLPTLTTTSLRHVQGSTPDTVVNDVQENLKFEQRSVLQFNWVLVHRILSPIQVALFMVQAWPSHCDCLAMVNTVNSLKDELMVSPLLHCAPSLQERVSN